MNKGIILDFNRTVFDPDANSLFPGALEAIKLLYHEGFVIVLVAKENDGRENLIKSLEIDQYFSEIMFVSEKTAHLFKEIKATFKMQANKSFVIGDRVRSEIESGNSAGFLSIWFQNGKFANELPENAMQFPNFTVHDWFAIMTIISFIDNPHE